MAITFTGNVAGGTMVIDDFPVNQKVGDVSDTVYNEQHCFVAATSVPAGVYVGNITIKANGEVWADISCDNTVSGVQTITFTAINPVGTTDSDTFDCGASSPGARVDPTQAFPQAYMVQVFDADPDMTDFPDTEPSYCVMYIHRPTRQFRMKFQDGTVHRVGYLTQL
jgi:hypothetical protein